MFRAVPTQPWIDPAEQPELVKFLYEHELLKFGGGRYPLKGGGDTDIFINLRDARNRPEALDGLAWLYSRPLAQLGVEQFIEVPHSVSCFAGLLSAGTDIPYLTVRPEEKAGHAAGSKIIGKPLTGKRAVVLDDVITTSKSKFAAIVAARERGLDLRAVVVLVDRQGGWNTGNGMVNGVPVWAGLTLHDVRKHLIQSLEVMERCDPTVAEKNPIILALDGKSWGEILPIIEQTRTRGNILKVNDLLFEEGFHLIRELGVYGRVMADLKIHDIKNTAENALDRLAKYNPWSVTVHASGGYEMMAAAVKALQRCDTKVLAVTVLTSIDEVTCEEIYTRRPLEQVKKLAEIAYRAGVHGFVCSPEEVAELKRLYPDMTFVTPGVRSKDAATGDQKRILTPHEAMENGANYVVMGRQVMGAKCPVFEIDRVLREELSIDLGLAA